MDIIEIINETYRSIAHSNSFRQMLHYRANSLTPQENGVDIGFFVLDSFWSYR